MGGLFASLWMYPPVLMWWTEGLRRFTVVVVVVEIRDSDFLFHTGPGTTDNMHHPIQMQCEVQATKVVKRTQKSQVDNVVESMYEVAERRYSKEQFT